MTRFFLKLDADQSYHVLKEVCEKMGYVWKKGCTNQVWINCVCTSHTRRTDRHCGVGTIDGSKREGLLSGCINIIEHLALWDMGHSFSGSCCCCLVHPFLFCQLAGKTCSKSRDLPVILAFAVFLIRLFCISVCCFIFILFNMIFLYFHSVILSCKQHRVGQVIKKNN